MLVIGVIAGVTLSGLLACTMVDKEFEVWPTPGKGSWQSRVFWSLFRTLNVATLALAFLDWQRWEGFSLERGLGATLAIVCFALYGWACYALGRRNLSAGGPSRHRRHLQLDAQSAIRNRNPGLSRSGRRLRLDRSFCDRTLLTLSFVLMAFAEEHWLEAAYGADYRRYRLEVARFYNWRHALAVLKQEVMPAKEASKEAPF